ncbi:MAG: sugar phosphate isomerase/epimerase [Pirellulaceae bacterium]|nr:sugar phosphate isomerase/epimerase [Pirellulaceae bacterium]
MKRRSFLSSVAVAAVAASHKPLLAAQTTTGHKIGLGMDNFAVREMGLKATGLLDHAASLKLDSLFISDLDAFESLDDGYLGDVKRKADELGIALYVGTWSICPTSKSFRTNRGTAEEHLRLGLRVAKTLGSPVIRVVLGTGNDRKTEGGIQARIVDTVAVLKACRTQALDMGIKVAVENHAGDMHSWELVQLIESAGSDFVGANFDSGNAAFTLEDPHDAFENLGKYTICSSLRDYMVWETPEGATAQWTAAGEGLIDWKKLAVRWSELCPNVPIMIETMYGRRDFPYKTADFWEHYDKRPESLRKFEAMAKRGKPIEARKPSGPNQDKLEVIEYQKGELARSIAYLRNEIGLGMK